MQKPIPKSLHTVTVLVAVARLLRNLDNDAGRSLFTSAGYVECAVRQLGYAHTPDVYELADKAAAILAKDAARIVRVAA